MEAPAQIAALLAHGQVARARRLWSALPDWQQDHDDFAELAHAKAPNWPAHACGAVVVFESLPKGLRGVCGPLSGGRSRSFKAPRAALSHTTLVALRDLLHEMGVDAVIDDAQAGDLRVDYWHRSIQIQDGDESDQLPAAVSLAAYVAGVPVRRNLFATGRLGPGLTVRTVEFLDEKIAAVAAEHPRACILVPAEQEAEAKRHAPAGVTVVGCYSLHDAIGAAGIADAALAKAAPNAELYQRGILHLNRHDYRTALKIFRRIETKVPKDSTLYLYAWRRRLTILLHLGDPAITKERAAFAKFLKAYRYAHLKESYFDLINTTFTDMIDRMAFEEAEKGARAALQSRQLERNSEDEIRLLGNLGQALMYTGAPKKITEAAGVFRAQLEKLVWPPGVALPGFGKPQGTVKMAQFARNVNYYAEAQRRAGDLDAAEAFYGVALDVYPWVEAQPGEGPDERDFSEAFTRLGLGRAALTRGRFDAALAHADRGLVCAREDRGGDYPHCALQRLRALALLGLGRDGEAEAARAAIFPAARRRKRPHDEINWFLGVAVDVEWACLKAELGGAPSKAELARARRALTSYAPFARRYARQLAGWPSDPRRQVARLRAMLPLLYY